MDIFASYRNPQGLQQHQQQPQPDIEPVQADKEVVFVTPVLFGSKHMPPQVHARSISYKRGQPLHQDRVLASCFRLPPGMVIDLPDKGIQDYVIRFLFWLHLPDDGTLVDDL